MTIPTYDVVIVGSGIVGLTAALALAKKTNLTIAVLESNAISFDWNKETNHYRVSAISLASKKIFENLGVWESVTTKRMSPYTDMHVWDARGGSEIHFDCRQVNERALGYIVEDSLMRSSLLVELRKYSTVEFIFPQKLSSMVFMPGSAGVELKTESSLRLKTKLLVGADGANSLVRKLLDIKLKTWDYGHTAIVTSLQTEFSHQQTARQRFLPTGPLAFLPLQGSHECSIVWSTSHAHAKELIELSDDDFSKVVSNAFENKLGAIQSTHKRYCFPLRMRHAKNYVQQGVALIGDAAHTIHPLAGQGVNLGLLDAACLAEVVIEAIKKNRDYASLATLRRYERWRKTDNLTLLAGVEMIKQVFMSENASIQRARGVGLNIANRTAVLKNFLMNYALGKRGDLPTMATV